MNFLDLCDLMYDFHRIKEDENSQFDGKPFTPVQIATEIEKNGCYGFDDYGRFIEPGQKGSEQITIGALKAVASTHAAYLKTDFENEGVERHLDIFFEYDMSLGRYGWIAEKLPKFSKPAAQPVLKKRGSKVHTQTVLLQGLMQLANDNLNNDWNVTLDDLFKAAGYPALKLDDDSVGDLHKKLGKKIKKETLENFLRQLGRLDK